MNSKINTSQPKRNISKQEKIRTASVAGQFYSDHKNELQNEIKNYLDNAQVNIETNKKVRAIIVPHAAYVFSGEIAAHSYKALEGQSIKRVFLLGNSHRDYFDGLAIDDNDKWQTPLGEVALDLDGAKKLIEASSKINFNSSIHKYDHILELQIPFLQTVIKNNFKIIPIVFGNKDQEIYTELAKILENNLEEGDLIVVSSDLSHYPNYKDARIIDQASLNFIKAKNISQLEEHIKETMNKKIPNEETLMCGEDAIKTIMEISKFLGWKAEILKYANSGDAPVGDKNTVVGYGSLIFLDNTENNELNEEQKNILLNIAKNTIENYIKNNEISDFTIEDPRLKKQEGAFVTIHKNGQLRGCVGQIVPNKKPLWQVVRDMAIAASAKDNRFLPVKEEELDDLDYEISVLSAPLKIENWQDIELGKDGVIIKKGIYGGVFLPQVASETKWSLEEFLSRLCQDKAGLAADCYKNDPGVILKTFTAQVFK